MTLDERLDKLERSLRECRIRLGLELPNDDELVELRKLGVVGIGRASTVSPGGTIGELPALATLRKAQAASREPVLTPEEACSHYGGESEAMLLGDAIRYLDPQDHRITLYPRGWVKVPARHVAALEAMKAVRIPTDMLAAPV
jgi:hypothetical protein